VLAFAAEWFQSRLREPAGAGARDYLQGRGLSLEEALDFGLGYADDEWRALRVAAARHGIEERMLLELGLLATSERAEEPYDRFRGRLMFTIHDMRDRPIGFGGRILDAASEAPKYINSPESPVFHKGEELYGLNRARHAMRREGHAAIAEGFTDVIALHRAGLGFAVAGLGTSFTADQAARIGRYTKRAYLLYDSDLAGLRATFRTGDILLAAGVHPMVVSLPSGEDPDSLIGRDGAAAIRHLLDDAVDLLERKLQILRREGYLDRVEGRRRAVDGLLSTLRAVSDPALRDIYVDRAVDGLGIRRETLVDEIARLESSRPRRRSPAAGPGRPRRGPPPASRTERDFLLLLVRDPALTRQAVRVGLAPDHMSDPRGRELFEILSAASDEGLDSPDWTSASASAADLAKALRESDRELPDAARVFDAVVRRLLYRRHRERIEQIGRAIKLAEPEQQRRLLGEKQELVRELRAAGESGAFMPAADGETPPKPTTATQG